jgi:hypothetical protein
MVATRPRADRFSFVDAASLQAHIEHVVESTDTSLPPGYRTVAVPLAGENTAAAVCGHAGMRWLAPAEMPSAEPLALDVSVTAFDGRTGALRALTAPPLLPDGVDVRPLFAPRIGNEALAFRADACERGRRYVLYRVDVQAGRCLATVAATWRWPAGSPSWVYERARRLAERLREVD